MKNATIKLLEMIDIEKNFPGVKALDSMKFDLNHGEVHAIAGENGAGKSTLMKILGGIYQPDAGQIYINGKQVEINSVQDAQDLGISIIHQELVFEPHMTVAENVYLGREPQKGLFIDEKTIVNNTEALLNKYNLPIKASDKMSDLTIANQQMVEIIKSVSFDAKIIVMDEPTSSISDKEIEKLFEMIADLQNDGVGIIYISHKLNETFEICDRVTVLRDGQFVDCRDIKDIDSNELVSLMVGRKLKKYFQRDYQKQGERLFSIEKLNDKELLKDVSFHVKRGEILGFSGLIGAGRSELMETIFGLHSKTSGDIYMDGRQVAINDPEDAIHHKMALIPEDRRASGLFGDRSVEYNLTINSLDKFISGVFYNAKKENEIATEYVEALNVKTPTVKHLIKNLSGGNQQKVILARWLATEPKLLILDEPTRGIDVGAKSEIYSIMNELVKEGVSIVMISSDLNEIINLSDRTYVMSDGEITGELEGEEMTQDNIMNLATKNF